MSGVGPANRSSTRRARARRSESPPARNPLLLISVGLLGLLLVVTVIAWVLPAGTPVSPAQLQAAVREGNELEVSNSGLQVQLKAADTECSNKTSHLASLAASPVSGQGGPPAAEVAALRAQVGESEARTAKQRIEVDQLRQANALAAGDQKLSAEVLKYVNARLLKIWNRDNDFVCATMVRGWYVTSRPGFRAELVVYGNEARAVQVPGVSNLRMDSSWLQAQRYDRADPTAPEFDRQGFTPADYERQPKEGQALYCLCHQMINGVQMNNSVVMGVSSGTQEIRGCTFLKTTLPCRPEMAGAPVVTSEGKLVGILMPRLPGVEDLSLVMPVALIDAAITGQ